jgi:monoamine oxidase
LAAARECARANKDVCVLEARPRVGGRIWSVERAGHRIDIGGAWVGPDNSEVRALAREFGVELHPTHSAGDNVLFHNGDAKRFHGTAPPLNPIGLASFALGMVRIDRMAKRLPIEAPYEAKRAGAWDATTAGAWIARNAAPGVGRDLLEAAVRGLMTCDPSEVSLLHFLTLVRSAGSLNNLLAIEGGYQQDLVVGGAATMAEHLADELGDRIVLEAPVREIAQSETRVRVIADNVEVECARVIVAAPPAIAAQIEFTPALPVDRVQLLERMPAGSAIKYVVQYDDAFWRGDGFSGVTVGMGGPIEMTIDAGPPSGSPGVMTAFAFGPHGRRMGELSDDGQRKVVLDYLASAFGARALQPVDYIAQDWSAEPWTHGCFMAHLAPGVLTQYGRILREPCGRVHWAGTETSFVAHGTFDGAIRSGKRAAAEVVSRG